ncbi:MGMT family protein [Pseudomonas sp. N040]|uniref:MGMT family protein n=1 Tax=Pseudomonas sp. N040 TaxID=2785325 RepID=UPI0018A2E0A7|nr:MGMT family protein [Pseudomonas sp. N040]MBF7729635.1 MGMT family protein [Pseudomonas sp. N040]MBW7013275.1 MGMT family protein [Pseudomonas sp. N040]
MNHSTPKGRAENARPDSTEASAQQRREVLYLCLASIPAGQVLSYGQLAAMAGAPGAARWAARILAQLPEGTALPWHRVITASGRPGLSPDCASGLEQRQRLRSEGILLTNDRVDMRRHGWRGRPASV